MPKPKFQGDFFGEMPRVFCIIQKIDLKRKVLTIKQDGSGAIRAVPIRDDTEIHFRDSWGELSDYFPNVKIWKGDHPGGIETLQPGDEVIQQLVEKDGQLAAVEIFDRKGDDAVRAQQDARHHADQDRLGLPAYVNDLEPISGSVVVSVAWSGSDRARTLKPGDAVTIVPSDGSKPFAALISEMQSVDTRERLQLIVNARAASRLAYGQSLRLFVPGTGPALPTGRAGLPVPTP